MIKKSIIFAITACVLLAESNVVELTPISVTATGIQESVLEQPLTISTKGIEEVKLDQVIYQKDLLNSLAGVRIEQTGSVIGHTTSIRMPRSTSSYYLFMQDGIPVQSSGFFNHNGLAYTTFQTASSVEVLKGAGTALYGSDAVAATINVASLTKPSKQKEIILKGMGGSNGYGSSVVEISDTIDENNGYRASVSYMHSDGWRNHTKTDRVEANIRYDHIINNTQDLKIIFNTSTTDAQQADSFNDYANIQDGSTAASDDDNYFTALQSTDVKRKFDYARLSAEWTNYVSDELEVSLTPYMRYNRNQYVATWESNLPSNDNKLATIGLLQRNTYDASWGKLIVGFDAEYTQSSLEYNQDFSLTTTGWSPKIYTAGALYDYDVDYFAVAPYMHAQYDITNKLMLSAGLRYDYNSYDYTNNLAADSNDSSGTYFRPADSTDSFSHLSPKLSLSYRPTKEMNIYARYANGFRIPQASRLYSVKVEYENINIDAEISNTYEVGIKKYFNKKAFLELSLYHMTIDDTIVKDNDTGGYRNGGSTIHQGVEFTTQLEMSQEFSTRLAYSYSKHNYDNDASYNDNEMQQAPNDTANVRLFYTPKTLKGLRVMAEYQYVGEWYLDNTENEKYDGYNVGNIKVDYQYNKDIRIFAKINNITDERYAVSARYAYGKYDYTSGDPRQYYTGLEYRW